MEDQPFANTPPPVRPKPSRRLLMVVVAAALIGLIAAIYLTEHNSNAPSKAVITTGQQTVPAAQVSIGIDGFSPATLQISAGTQVTWINDDNQSHQVAADPHPLDNSIPDFDSTKVLLPKDTYSFKFDTAGTYHVHDEMHPLDNLETVIVK